MEQKLNDLLSTRIISILLALLCCGATASWSAGAGRSRPTPPRRPASPARPSPSLSGGTAVIDPCVPAGASADSALAADPKADSRDPKSGRETRGPLARDLWASRIAAPEASDDAQTSLALKRLIRQVRVLTLNDKNATPPPAITAEPPATTETPMSASTSIESIEPAPRASATPVASQGTPALSSKTQKTLEDLRKNAGRVRDPLEVAELLFLSGRPTEAVPFYEEALRRTGTGAAASGADRAWILFQLGNCLRETDATKAQDTYTKLIAEYPNSPWTEMARASGRLLAWYQSTRPDQLMAPPKP